MAYQDKFGMLYDTQEQANAANATSAAQTVKTPAPAVDTAHALTGGGTPGNLIGSQADIDAYFAGQKAVSSAPAGQTSNNGAGPINIAVPAAGGGSSSSSSGGIIGSAINNASGITPWNITAEQTTAGQLKNVTDPNSPLNQQLRAQALQQANARGIVNSSIAESAAMDAILKNAVPIASSDAATYSKAAGYNADQANQQLSLDKNLGQQWNIAKLQQDTQKMNNESAQLIARLNNEQQTTANQLQQENQKLINTNNQAATAYNNTLNYITSINQNANMDANTKTRAVAQAWYGLQTQLRTLSKVAGLDLTSSLSLAGAPGFNAQGEYVGFNDDGTTKGSAAATPAPNKPAVAPAPAPETGLGA